MSEIYRLINKDTGTEQFLVSKEYVDLRVRALKDAILTHIQNIDNSHSNSTDPAKSMTSILDNAEIVDIDLSLNIPEITTDKIKTDPQHKFVTQSQLEVFKDKPTSHEVETMINNNINDIKNRFNEMYARLLNMPDVVKRLKEIAKVVNDDENLSFIYDALDAKVDDEEFNEHITSYIHMNNEDRKALNILLNMIQDGTIEKVKNVSLDYCNSAFNAYNLDGKTPDQVRSRGEFHKVYSIAGCNDNEADFYFYGGGSIDKEINAQEIYNMVGKVLFRECDTAYLISAFLMDRSDIYKALIIQGCGNGTIFKTNRCFVNNVEFRDCAFLKSDYLQVKNNVVFRNVQFDNCNIYLENSTRCKFIDCTFNNCVVKMNKVCTYNKFSECYFYKTNIPKYIGGNNLFINNMENL